MMEPDRVFDVSFHSQFLERLQTKGHVDSFFLRYKFKKDEFSGVKKDNEHRFDVTFAHSGSLGARVRILCATRRTTFSILDRNRTSRIRLRL